MASNPLITVLLPAYQAAPFLEEALQSLQRQSFTDFEVLILDDGSTDGTREIARCWAEKDPRFQVIGLPHRGLVATLNEGLSRARGTYLARMDADDRCHPERLELQAGALRFHPEIGVVGSRITLFPRDAVTPNMRRYVEWQNSVMAGEDFERELFVESPMAHDSILVRTGELRSLGGWQDLGWAEDHDLWLRYYLAGYCFLKLRRILLAVREHQARITRTHAEYDPERFRALKLHYLLRSHLKDRPPVVLVGAGPEGKAWSRSLQAAGVTVAAFSEVHPRRIGQTIHGAPVLAHDDPSIRDRGYVLVALGQKGARDVARQHLTSLGCREVTDFLCVQ